MIDYIWKYIGEVVAALGGVGVVVAVAWQGFKHFGSKWLDERFEERLLALKHAQAKEIEEVRFEISRLVDRATKLHQREFEVLPEAWRLLNEAYWSVRKLVAALREYPDLNRMTDQHREEFLEKSRLMGWEKAELRNQGDKTAYYQKRIQWHDNAEAEEKLRGAYTYFLTNAIFFEEPLRNRFTALHDLTWEALLEHDLGLRERELGYRADREHIVKFNREGSAQLQDLEKAVRNRLWIGQPAAEPVKTASK